jgi:hypothetical protein
MHCTIQGAAVEVAMREQLQLSALCCQLHWVVEWKSAVFPVPSCDHSATLFEQGSVTVWFLVQSDFHQSSHTH